MDKRITPLIRSAEAQGWRVKEAKKGWVLYPPDPSLSGVTIHKTPSDRNWYQAALRLMRARGYVPNV